MLARCPLDYSDQSSVYDRNKIWTTSEFFSQSLTISLTISRYKHVVEWQNALQTQRRTRYIYILFHLLRDTDRAWMITRAQQFSAIHNYAGEITLHRNQMGPKKTWTLTRGLTRGFQRIIVCFSFVFFDIVSALRLDSVTSRSVIASVNVFKLKLNSPKSVSRSCSHSPLNKLPQANVSFESS